MTVDGGVLVPDGMVNALKVIARNNAVIPSRSTLIVRFAAANHVTVDLGRAPMACEGLRHAEQQSLELSQS